jgi:hypothetical protein
MNSHIKYVLIGFIILQLYSIKGFSQIDSVIIEKYYVARGVDTSQFLAGFTPLNKLPEGSVTYRVYLDLEEGSKLLELFGTEDHPFIISSTDSFFNNNLRESHSLGYFQNTSDLARNTYALDTWITMGLATTDHYGVLKRDDTDGSIDQIINNQNGVLRNENPQAGIPLVAADGLRILDEAFQFSNAGILGQSDTTIFQFSGLNTFKSTNFRITSSEGFSGPDENNRILICQLTTLGEVSFTFNIKVIKADGSRISYLGKDTLIDQSNREQFSSWLSYPFNLRKGCMDPYFAEYDPTAVIDDGSCNDSVKYGCLDSTACNFNNNANFHIEELCCYDSKCSLDLDDVCPGTIYGCMDPDAANYNPQATAQSEYDGCCYHKGCMDHNFIEYDPAACYQDSSDCKVLKVTGCMDKSACNYNPVANVSSDCDYSSCLSGEKKYGFTIQPDGKQGFFSIRIYPNPVKELLNIDVSLTDDAKVSYEFLNLLGQTVMRFDDSFSKGISMDEINVTELDKGIYLVRVRVNDGVLTTRIIKQ